MKQSQNLAYRTAADQFARAVTRVLGDQIRAVVLYGSVAREKARSGSDVDLLVVGSHPELRDEVLDIAHDLMESAHFETFLNVAYLTQQEFIELVELGSPFVGRIVGEGEVLYDDGTFARVRQGVSAGGSGNSGRS